MISSNVKLIILVSCLAALMPHRPSNALLLSNFIGCNSFGCRISALENDVAQLKQQVSRLDPTHSMQGMNNFRPNQLLPFNQNGMNQQGIQNQHGQQGQQAQQGQQSQQSQQGGTQQAADGGPRVSYSLDYPIMNQNLRRSQPGYQNGMNNGQYLGGVGQD